MSKYVKFYAKSADGTQVETRITKISKERLETLLSKWRLEAEAEDFALGIFGPSHWYEECDANGNPVPDERGDEGSEALIEDLVTKLAKVQAELDELKTSVSDIDTVEKFARDFESALGIAKGYAKKIKDWG